MRSINPQAASINTVVSSESALVTTTPVMPNGTNWRCATSIVVVVSPERLVRKEKEHSQFEEPDGVGKEPVTFAVPTGPGVPARSKKR